MYLDRSKTKLYCNMFGQIKNIVILYRIWTDLQQSYTVMYLDRSTTKLYCNVFG